jgi:23S rRNA (pseudouridine1915-N3)-methyltransferase
MRIRVLAVGSRMPDWVRDVCADYALRLRASLKLMLLEIPAGPRSGPRGAQAALRIEAKRLLVALRPKEFVVALDERGDEFTTRELAAWLEARRQAARDVAFLIGGPDGLDPEVIKRADFKLSLSRLTLPHALVRVLLTEQLYRAQSLLENHPYHRE